MIGKSIGPTTADQLLVRPHAIDGVGALIVTVQYPINLPHPVQYGRFVKIDADLTIMP